MRAKYMNSLKSSKRRWRMPLKSAVPVPPMDPKEVHVANENLIAVAQYMIYAAIIISQREDGVTELALPSTEGQQ